jgi:4-carboxymuconolactone decarboxylase
LMPLSTRTSFEIIADFLIADREGSEGLTAPDRRLAKIGSLLAIDPCGLDLRAAFREALEAGWSLNMLQTLLIHAVGYLGVIRMRSAHQGLMVVLNETGNAIEAGTPVELDRTQRVALGSRLYDRFDPGRQIEQAKLFEPLSATYYPRAMELSGLTLAPPALALRERQIMTIAMLSCLGGQSDQLRFHLAVALRNGVERETLAGILILVQAYAGMPRANTAATLALEALREEGQSHADNSRAKG